MKNKKRSFTVPIIEGDAIIHLKSDKTVALVFAEDGDTIAREMAWPDHEVYKAAVQFALMIDSYLRNSKALDDLITTSATGSIPAELIGRDLLPIMLAGAGLEEFQEVEEEDEEEKESENKPEYKDNIIQFKRKDKNNEDK